MAFWTRLRSATVWICVGIETASSSSFKATHRSSIWVLLTMPLGHDYPANLGVHTALCATRRPARGMEDHYPLIPAAGAILFGGWRWQWPSYGCRGFPAGAPR